MGFWVRGVKGLGWSERVSGYWVCLVGSELRDWAGRLFWVWGFSWIKGFGFKKNRLK